MKRYKLFKISLVLRVRRVFFFAISILVSIHIFGVGFTPTDCGLAVKLEHDDQILLSTWIDIDNDGVEDPGEEFFVCDFVGYIGGHFGYQKGSTLKLIPQAGDATEPSSASIWTIDTALVRANDRKLGGLAYTMWSSDGYTLSMKDKFRTQGALIKPKNKVSETSLADVVFVVPTILSTSADPKNTLGRAANEGDPFDGRTGTGFLGMTYREVYWFDIPRSNAPYIYGNASLVGFNTTLSEYSYAGDQKASKGQALYAFADDKHKPTRRTLFRLYILNKPLNSCPDSYFFAYDEQDYLKYRIGPNTQVKPNTTIADSTESHKVYYMDRLECMERYEDTKYYHTRFMYVPEPDSTYFYVGYRNDYRDEDKSETMGTGGAHSMFRPIDSLKLQYLGITAPKGVLGRMVIDTTSSAENLGVTFRPAGVFLRTSSGRNIELSPEKGDTSWICNEMWTITKDYAKLLIRATLYSQSEFSDEDEGIDIPGWSENVVGTSVPVVGRDSIIGVSGWARVYLNKKTANGGMEFVPANKNMYIRYDNNGLLGVSIPNQHPFADSSKVTILNARLNEGFSFTSWNTAPDGNGTSYDPGTPVRLDTFPGDSLILYAQGEFLGGVGVAISFMQGDKRYFLTHPGTAPRFATGRTFGDWTNVWQGMADVKNIDPAYLSTYRLIGKKEGCVECDSVNDEVFGPIPYEKEYVLDPRRETVRAHHDSVIFYEHFMPSQEEYIGLYFTTPNTILANDTWAGLFQSSEGWPTFSRSHVDNTKLYSSNYLHRVEGEITKAERLNSDSSYVKYDPASNSFVGVSTVEEGTEFQLSSMSVVDDYYVILPDTTREEEKWTNEVVFGLHTGEPLEERIWSKLIGKQLMLQMQVGDQLVHFHPNNDKTYTTASQLWLSPAYRLTQTFEYLRDRRVEVDEEYQTNMFEPGIDFARAVVSSTNSPMDIRDAEGNYTDIIDTIRVTLYPRDSKIKRYYGIWADDADGVHVRANGSRYRDILVRTKTFHYGATEQKVVLIPEQKTYNFSPLANQSEQITFRMAKVSSRQLLDVEGNVMGEEYLSSTDVTSSLALGPSDCSLKNSGIFTIESAETNHVTLKTVNDNTEQVNHDTLLITKTVRVEGVDYVVTARVPLMQADLAENEIVWSVVDNNVRYFIMAGEDGSGNKKLIFRRYRQGGNTLYQLNTSTPLVKGSLDAANSDEKYITPWKFSYVNQANQQLKLFIESPVNLDFLIASESTPAVVNGGTGSGSSTLTYRYAAININDNANFEEMVRLKYGVNSWLKFQIVDGQPTLTLQEDSASASIFSWTYLQEEYSLLNNGDYPNKDYLEFGYNNPTPASITTRYKARKEYSMLLNNTQTYCGRVEETNLTNLGLSPWYTQYTVTKIEDSRFSAGASGLSAVTNSTTLQTVVTPSSATSPTGTMNIVDTLDVQISLKSGAPKYRFADQWSSFKSVEDAHLKIPLIRKAYHTASYDSLICVVENDEYNYTFPNTLPGGTPVEHTFYLGTQRHVGTNIFDANNRLASYIDDGYTNLTKEMKLGNAAYAEIRLMDQFGNTPSWCELTAKGDSTLTVQCTQNGIRAPRTATLYIAYTMQIEGVWRYVNFRLTVSQPSLFHYTNNQELIHTKGASGDDLDSLGMQQVHTNRRILYYYNPSRTIPTTDQRVELPIRERGFYGWWRWYREGTDEKGDNVGDTDIPDSVWAMPPRNVGKFNYPFRIIGDSVYIDEEDHSKGKKFNTQGRYTVFHVPSNDYNARKDPPSKNAWIYPPKGGVATYAVDLSVYYDNLPLSMKDVNQIDTAVLDTMQRIMEPTLSLREIFELHPWTEMADTLDHYKVNKDVTPSETEKYMEDHEVMAPMGTPLLLTTEQRYSYTNLQKGEHSESLLGYYMRDDNWSSMSSDRDGDGVSRQDTMIWCGGWDATCAWYTYNPKTHRYDTCRHTITEENDFLNVPAKTSMPTGQNFDTVYYCLRARSMKSNIAPDGEGDDGTVDGDYWFNICRYKIIYHRTSKYGPLAEKKNGAGSLISNTEIEQNYEVLERLNFDYNKPGTDYQVYHHPLPWEDASYGFAYPMTDALPDNRPHNATGLSNLANMGEYNLINRIPLYGTFWHKMEQHGGAANGYMIYCDGMSSAGQVAALSIESHLCEGQKLYFSGYVGNPMNQTGKTQPNFLFSVQGSTDGDKWEDITSYMTGNIPPSSQWYQIYFPIYHERSYSHFRVRVFNMASNDDGNDFIIDDLCLFATKPPLVAYQANTTCRTAAENDSITHVVLRLDYQGMKDETFNGREVYYTITKDNDAHFLKLEDGYYEEATLPAVEPSTVDTVYGTIHVPTKRYEPTSHDSIFKNLQDLINQFEGTLDAHEAHLADESKPDADVFRQGYIYEVLDGAARPVMYIVHTAKMTADNTYKVRVSGDPHTFMSSICAMTSSLKIKNRMMLTIDGEEKEAREVNDLCSNSAYDLSLRIKGSLLRDSVAPIDINGSCVNDWLLYGDTAAVSSERRYGYKYSDIEKIIKDILRYEVRGDEANKNQFARNLGEISRKEMERVKELTEHAVTLDTEDDPYDVIKHLVDSGYLTLYRSNLTASIIKKNDSLQYVIFPIEGTGSDALLEMNVDVCPTPILIKLKSPNGGDIPLTVGGFGFDTTALVNPSVILADVRQAYTEIAVPIDSIRTDVALDSIIFMSTNDPNYLEGIHRLGLVPDRQWITDHPDYYMNADTLFLEPAPNNNYRMQAGYSYNYGFVMKTRMGSYTYGDGCPVGTVPVTISVVPDHLRWDPQSGEDGRWNNPDNWIGIDQMNRPLPSDARFAPLPSTRVVIPAMEEGVPYPTLKVPENAGDTVKQTHFRYNVCNAIRFLPGAAMGQPQLMAYNDVVVDMDMPHNKWALRSTPVTGMISGDLFMANADLNWETPTWEVGAFDAAGRSYSTGNASYWLSLYNRSTTRIGNPSFEKDTTRTGDDTWSKVTNAMKEPLRPAQGWAVYSYTKSGNDPDVRLPKKDDIYYYYTKSGEKVLDKYEHDLTAYRDEIAGGTGKAGKLAFQPEAGTQSFSLSNDTAATSFVFGNPTMSYLDIWGFIADNSTNLVAEIRYVDAAGSWQTATWGSLSETDTLSSLTRYLPPMHVIVLKANSAAKSLTVNLNTNRLVTAASQCVTPRPGDPAPTPAPSRSGNRGITGSSNPPFPKGIMTITAVNPASSRCTSRLLLGQGFHADIIAGEDAVLTTINIDHYTNNTNPATPFNIYAREGSYGLSIDLLDSIVNVPLSFNMTPLNYHPVTSLWFTGVHAITGDLVLYDAFTDTERPIIDGIRLDIETPEVSHTTRYYIRRPGYQPDSQTESQTATGLDNTTNETKALKIIHSGHVYILRDGHVFTMYGQQIR